MIFIQALRRNDINPNGGKQFEFGKSFFESFDWEVDSTNEVTIYAGDDTIITNFKVRGSQRGGAREGADCKEYANAQGEFPLKDYLIYHMKFTEEHVGNVFMIFEPLDQYGEEFNLYFTPKKKGEIANNKTEGVKSKTPIILYGPPGTGKTYEMQRNYISKFKEEDRFITTFHQSFSYEEFVEGIKPILDSSEGSSDIKYTIENGVFRNACERAAKLAGYESLSDCIDDTYDNRCEAFSSAIQEGNTVLLCIDEINRGNVVSIFGDLISLIEESKRLGGDNELMVTLPYSKAKFGVPSNLLIVGTMNTADRSIQVLDSALRRRFKFKELLPDYSVFETDNVLIKPFRDDAKKILQNINARVRCLLNKDNQIGHSYLMFAESHKDIFEAIVNKIIPLLEEYFYNDIEKVRFVLNENDSTKYKFYKEDKVAKEAYESYIQNADIDSEDKSFYELNYQVKDDSDYTNYLKHLLGLAE